MSARLEIPAFDWLRVVVEPWALYPETTIWIVLMGWLVSLVCGAVGLFLILRRMAMTGDAISHSVLPGLVLAFLWTASRATLPMMLGALIAGVLSVILIEWIHRSSRVKPDAAMGIVFSLFFAVGVILVTAYADHIDLDADCVLYGEIAYVPLEPMWALAGIELGPAPVMRMAMVGLIVAGLGFLFFKELITTSFDPVLAASLGLSPKAFHYGLMIVLSVVIVSSFEAVGAILVVAMLIFPGATALLLTHRLRLALALLPMIAALHSLLGYHLAVWFDVTVAGSMAVAAGGLLAIAWAVYCIWARVARSSH
ncbi:MAG: metal ABC transporter permease [Opitutales bacterium]|nr:metal ABC transporter permease [Opitutales bacterium]